MKKRVLKRIRTILILFAISYCALSQFADAQSEQSEYNGAGKSTSYVAAAALDSMFFDIYIMPSVGVSQLYVRGQTFHTNLSDDEFDPSWSNQSQGITRESQSYSTNSSSSLTRRFWAAPFYNTLRIKGEEFLYLDTELPFKMEPFLQTRTGFYGGVDWTTADERDSVGLILGYGRGHMRQRSINDTYLDPILNWKQLIQTRINVADMQFGATWNHTMDCGAKLTAVVLGGFQDYGWRREVAQLDDLNERALETAYTALFNGNTLGAMISLSKSFELGSGWNLTARGDFESVHSWIYATNETGECTGYTIAWAPYDMCGEKIYASRNTFRGGATLAYTDENGFLALTAMYGRQLEDSFEAKIQSSNDIPYFGKVQNNIKSSGYGKDSLLTGARLIRYVNASKTMQISGDYQLTLYKKASNQMVSAGFATLF